jgi:hypothetical protein
VDVQLKVTKFKKEAGEVKQCSNNMHLSADTFAALIGQFAAYIQYCGDEKHIFQFIELKDFRWVSDKAISKIKVIKMPRD